MEFLRRRLGLIFRAVVSLLAIWWVVHANDWSKVWHNVLTMDYNWLLVGIVCFVPTLLVVSWRWRLLLRVHDVQMRLWRVFELNMIGQFFSTVGVGTTGGDVFKIFYVTRAVPEKKTAVAFTVIADRIIGLLALLLFGVALSFTKLPLLLSTGHTSTFTMTFYIFAAVGAVGAIVTSLSPLFLGHRAIVSLIDRLPFAHRSRRLVGVIERTARAIGANILALVVSIPSHMSITLMGYCVLRAMHLQPDLLAFCSIIAIVNMLIALPVSISGIGVREQLFTWFFALLGIDGEKAVTFSLTYFALNILWSVAGGPFYFLYRHETHTPPPDVSEVEPIFSEQ
jgi:glycosyltransferase 2 family protein